MFKEIDFATVFYIRSFLKEEFQKSCFLTSARPNRVLIGMFVSFSSITNERTVHVDIQDRHMGGYRIANSCNNRRIRCKRNASRICCHTARHDSKPMRFYPNNSRQTALLIQNKIGIGKRRMVVVSSNGISEILALGLAIPPACFDSECQRSKDMLYVASLLVPSMVFGVAALMILKSKDSIPENYQVFDDERTGNAFLAPEGSEPARDRKGKLAYRPYSYTPYPVDASVDDEEVRILVGPVGNLQPQSFMFPHILNSPSEIVVIQLPRPLGLVFEEEEQTGHAVIVDIIKGSHAAKLCQRASLDPSLEYSAPKEGDVLRAITCTNIVYQTGALLFGAQKPQRSIILFGADGQKWASISAALRKGLYEDGNVTVVLERQNKNEKDGRQ